ncbi:hypothetical protein Acr_29g0002460 [Actinidia rufa]|uniref:Uncharacterized protein n=1 Tax=Actinidia rufa TaxID=165716 RepID=A0A7J0HED4_9ERIC|nr:hypothetical protein Acr_29g0002460 [Actinidia rufa]
MKGGRTPYNYNDHWVRRGGGRNQAQGGLRCAGLRRDVVVLYYAGCARMNVTALELTGYVRLRKEVVAHAREWLDYAVTVRAYVNACARLCGYSTTVQGLCEE